VARRPEAKMEEYARCAVVAIAREFMFVFFLSWAGAKGTAKMRKHRAWGSSGVSEKWKEKRRWEGVGGERGQRRGKRKKGGGTRIWREEKAELANFMEES